MRTLASRCELNTALYHHDLKRLIAVRVLFEMTCSASLHSHAPTKAYVSGLGASTGETSLIFKGIISLRYLTKTTSPSRQSTIPSFEENEQI